MRDPCFNFQCGSFAQRFSSGLETLVEQLASFYHDFFAPFNLLCVVVVHVRNVGELGVAE